MPSEESIPVSQERIAPVSQSLCPRCGRDLGTLRVGKCPGCGTKIGLQGAASLEDPDKLALPSPAPLAVDLGGPIPDQWHLRCVECGYSLTGLTSRQCPECGQVFRPRETWVANRQPSRRERLRRMLLLDVVVLAGLAFLYFYPLLAAMIPIWALGELILAALGWRTHVWQIFCGGLFIVSAVLAVVFL